MTELATSDPTVDLVLTIIKVITVALGVVIVYLGYKAYRATLRRPLLYLTIGIAIMTLGAVSEGAAFRGFRWTLDQSHVFEAVVTLVAYVFLVYSLYR